MPNPTAPKTPDEVVNEFTISVEQVQDYEFRVRFDRSHYPDLEADEPAPLGQDKGPNASRILAAAIGNCLSASLLFCARKARVEVGPIHTRVTTRVARNEHGRLRVTHVKVKIDAGIPEAERQKAQRCLDLFEDFCVVTQSVRQGIPVEVSVEGA